MPRFTFEAGRWYAMTMIPGYQPEPYLSPIRVHHFSAGGDRTFEIQYLNLAYVAGVQEMRKRFRTLHRTSDYIAALELGAQERLHVYQELTRGWLRSNFDQQAADPVRAGVVFQQAWEAAR
jgi:hypothetical protein